MSDNGVLGSVSADSVLSDFAANGFAVIRNVLRLDEIATLRKAIDRVWEDPGLEPNRYSDLIAVRLFEVDAVFEEIVTRSPIIEFVEGILGNDCHLIAQNAVRTPTGTGLSAFHVDDLVLLPIGEGMTRHDPRLTLPTYVMTVQVPLTDILTVENGPTQYVPGSHYSGREPAPEGETFEGRGPQSVLVRAGDIYLHNGQCWHQGAVNTSAETRYLLQMAYGRRFVAQRFYPFINYRLPENILARADDRRKRVFGVHP
ncbi:MAG: phytanoyl-CoA dioxygenase family protein, partial [Actinobacteria bacterium]|nr:phytanoyl-CoA dioxygenase family protein [Actinomycetota bacterium]